MKPISPSPLRALSALFAFLFLCGCFAEKNTRVAGGDDIPNDVEPLGKHAAAARDDSADWNGFKSAPRTAPGMYDTASVPDSTPDTAGAGLPQPKRSAGSAENAPMAKRSASRETNYYGGSFPIDSLPFGNPFDTVTIHIVDSAQGAVEAVHGQVKDNVRTMDTTRFVPVDAAHPGSPAGVLFVSGRVSYADTGLWKTYTFRDADGDGFLTPQPGAANLADLDLAAKAADGKVARLSQRIAAGPDLDFNRRGDNRLLASLMVVTSGTDTLRTVRLLDADGDSAVIDFSKDTNLVDVIETDRNPGDTGASVAIAERLVVYSRDSTRNYAVRYRRSELRADGSILVLEGRGPGPDSAFRAGDEAAWMVTRTFPQANSASLATRTFTVRLGAKPGDFAADSLVRLQTTEHYRDQAYEAFSFSLRPDAPVADGRWPAAGEVEASLLYRDGAVTVFSGAADAAGMHGSVKDVSGSVLAISFDRQGRPATAR
ncbi:MAG: hypothetical protein JF616_04995 [Fibrobacteres bacterium]|nr:hypothetical protein [Fibrobacterota bacterium]